MSDKEKKFYLPNEVLSKFIPNSVLKLSPSRQSTGRQSTGGTSTSNGTDQENNIISSRGWFICNSCQGDKINIYTTLVIHMLCTCMHLLIISNNIDGYDSIIPNSS